MKEIIAVLNRLVFLTPRDSETIHSLVLFSLEIQKDFMSVCRQINKNLPLKRSMFTTDRELILEYCKLFAELNVLQTGFTPYFASDEKQNGTGLNCLGRAISLGSFLKLHGFKIKLGIMPDHAVVLVELDNELHYCDIRFYVLPKMQGTFTSYKGYTWYKKHESDGFFANYIVIHDFETGILNAIFENFSFIASSHRKEDLSKGDMELASLNAKELGYSRLIQSADWKKMQKEFFPGMNKYKEDHRINFLLERQRTEEMRFLRDLRFQFDIVVANSYEQATGKTIERGEIKNFHTENQSVMEMLAQEIIDVLSMGVEFSKDVPIILKNYILGIRNGIQHDQNLKDYAVFRIAKRLQGTQAV